MTQLEHHHVVKAHDEVRHIVDVIHYEPHEQRTESAEFRRDKERLKASGRLKCFIDNGRCEGHVELHHGTIEYSAASEVDWDAIKRDLGFDHVDDEKQMIPLCHRHHMGKYTGVHFMTYNAWILQKYMTPKALEAFEAEVRRLEEGAQIRHG